MGYTVKAGDSWTKIAGQEYGDQRYYLRLMEANPGVSVLTPGMKIKLPSKKLFEDAGGQQQKPRISERNWALSTSKSGNRLGRNIVGTEGYIPTQFGFSMQGYAEKYGPDALNYLLSTGQELQDITMQRQSPASELFFEDFLPANPLTDPDSPAFRSPETMGWEVPEYDVASPGAVPGGPTSEIGLEDALDTAASTERTGKVTMADQILDSYGPTTSTQKETMKEAIDVLGLDLEGSYQDRAALQNMLDNGTLIQEAAKMQAEEALAVENRYLNEMISMPRPVDQLRLLGQAMGLGVKAAQNLPAGMYSWMNEIQQREGGPTFLMWQKDENGRWFHGPVTDATAENMIANHRQAFAPGFLGQDNVRTEYTGPDGDTYSVEVSPIGSEMARQISTDIVLNNGYIEPEKVEGYVQSIAEDMAKEGLVGEDGQITPALLSQYIAGLSTENKELILRVVELMDSIGTTGLESLEMGPGDVNPLLEFWPDSPILAGWYGDEYDPYMGGGGYLPNRTGGNPTEYIFSPQLVRWTY